MLQEIITGTILYWSTAMDLILISVVMIAAHPIAGKKQQIILGPLWGDILNYNQSISSFGTSFNSG